VLGFPCNQFGAQEPGSDAEILEFAQSKYGVDFPLFSKIDVNGDGACDVYRFLKSGNPDDDGNEDIAWNFTKFLTGRDGQVLERFGPQITPEEIGEAIRAHLE
jgi:glutathione peroxidase